MNFCKNCYIFALKHFPLYKNEMFENSNDYADAQHEFVFENVRNIKDF